MEKIIILLLISIIFVSCYHVPSRSFLLPKSTKSSLLYSSIAEKISNKKDIDFRNLIASNGRDELFLFVIDLSFVGSTRRIHALQGAIGTLLPQHKVSVITCFENHAVKILEPTSSLMAASRALGPLKKISNG